MDLEVENKTEAGIILPEKSKIQQLLDNVDEAQKSWKAEDVILEYHQMWRMSVENSYPKAHLCLDEADWISQGKPVWDEESTFIEFLDTVKKELVEIRIPENDQKYKTWQEAKLTPFQKSIQGFADEIKFDDLSETEKIDKTLYDWLDWAHHKQIEAIDDFLKGKIKIFETDVLDDEVNRIILEVADKFTDKRFGKNNKLAKTNNKNKKQSKIIQ